MQCFVCNVQFVKLLTADCDCDGDDPAIVNVELFETIP